MFKDFFRNRNKYVTVKRDRNGDEKLHKSEGVFSPQGKTKEGDQLWIKCDFCQEIIFNKKLMENQMVCPVCDYHFRVSARDRLKWLLDEGSFIELFSEIVSDNPLNFKGYSEKLQKAQKETGLNEAVVTGRGKLKGIPIAIGVMDFSFAGGSMGSAVGEKVTSLIEYALSKRLPLIIISTAGGARMQEGMLSLMQMAKTSAALAKFDSAGLLYISILTDPTSGGVTASYAMLGDINLAEPGALIAFAGPRVIKQTIRQELPEGFQKAEFLLEHGMIDRVVHRHKLRDELFRILQMHRLVGEVS
ncbi:acetyl-CoA carboxylase subunit beta [Anoxybacter fermentans]|uniref:Acetyl-coenzyme A carboxylase carboxyl transferase subunit beta n=1 Tax=Anoxybacter fermentans TaxID=1323375 RepID=A0A3S9T260_9FIRM|nr:acetyl-CoA carboxylase, carboxyltransferase subunit beta [Anoxybacter fermentans]AZR74621.1 acetyl-CoA carboxylase subunit beta [Anoxybacter fermentans]